MIPALTNTMTQESQTPLDGLKGWEEAIAYITEKYAQYSHRETLINPENALQVRLGFAIDSLMGNSTIKAAWTFNGQERLSEVKFHEHDVQYGRDSLNDIVDRLSKQISNTLTQDIGVEIGKAIGQEFAKDRFLADRTLGKHA
jgi:hypothetical protein